MRVELKLTDPDAGYLYGPSYLTWPTVRGTIVAFTTGLYGKKWALLALDETLDPSFEPLQELPEKFLTHKIDFLLLKPSPNTATDDIPPDLIEDELGEGHSLQVGVSVGPPPERLPNPLSLDILRESFPSLCAGRLKRAL